VVVSNPGGQFHDSSEFFDLLKYFDVFFNRAGSVFVSVKRPDRHVLDFRGINEIFCSAKTATRRRCSSGKILGIQLNENVGAMSAHGMAHDVDAVMVDRRQRFYVRFDFLEIFVVPQVFGLGSHHIARKCLPPFWFG